jgi:hypothetical protein
VGSGGKGWRAGLSRISDQKTGRGCAVKSQ